MRGAWCGMGNAEWGIRLRSAKPELRRDKLGAGSWESAFVPQSRNFVATSWELGAGSWEPRTENREPGTANWEQETKEDNMKDKHIN